MFNDYIYEGITLTGCQNFINRTVKALDLIKKAKGDYDYFAFVKSCIGQIKESPKSGMAVYMTPPCFNVGYKTYTSPTTWYASAIVHDANHSYLYKIGKVYYGQAAEDDCNYVQMEFLRRINGPKHYIDYLQHLINDKIDYFSDPDKVTW